MEALLIYLGGLWATLVLIAAHSIYEDDDTPKGMMTNFLVYVFLSCSWLSFIFLTLIIVSEQINESKNLK